ncbi:MAG: 2OG-Fe(II) oxygenase [Candidatus Woesearchaeota archaeon]
MVKTSKITDYTFKDLVAIKLMQPISKKKWLNAAIINAKREELSKEAFKALIAKGDAPTKANDLVDRFLGLKKETSHFDRVDELKQVYKNNSPYPHIVLNNFLPQELVQGVDKEIKNIPDEVWDGQESHYFQTRKRGLSDNQKMPPKARKIMEFLNSDKMLRFLEELTGIQNLKADPYNAGGGIHQTLSGGKLGIHTDFNTHSITGLYRRVNIIFYVNSNWKAEWGGGLELWDETASNRIKTVDALFNRAAIFTASEKSYHGHPEPLKCPENESRLSFAVYYYTEEKPEQDIVLRYGANWVEN